MKKSFFLIVVFLLISKPWAYAQSCWSYDIYSYFNEPQETLLSISKFISFNDFLFELRLQKKVITERNLKGTHSVEMGYDTIGVYVMEPKGKLYYEFDKFTTDATLKNSNQLSLKPSGFKVNRANNEYFIEKFKYLAPVFVQPSVYESAIVSKDKQGIDSISKKVVLLKVNNLQSIYKIQNINFPSKGFTIVGVSVHDSKTNTTYTNRVRNLRCLSIKTSKICKALIEKLH